MSRSAHRLPLLGLVHRRNDRTRPNVYIPLLNCALQFGHSSTLDRLRTLHRTTTHLELLCRVILTHCALGRNAPCSIGRDDPHGGLRCRGGFALSPQVPQVPHGLLTCGGRGRSMIQLGPEP